jgi:hypothetical protein
MLIAIVGGVLAALGLLSAVALVAAPLGLSATSPGLTLWVLFPLFTLVGYALLVAGSRDPAVKLPTLALAVPLLLLALAAAVALVAGAAGWWAIGGEAGTAALWYVMVLGGLLGALGTAASGRRIQT